MTDEPLYCDPQFAQFYDWANPWPEDFDFFTSLVGHPCRVLDLGCGTGIFSVALAGLGHQVTGVDPASAMLEIARARAGGEQVTWIEDDARQVELSRRFDMVVMTGHAFQTMLSRQDRAAIIATIARHLDAGGRFFFDSRNPEDRAWSRWTPDRTKQTRPHPRFGEVSQWNDASRDPATGIVTYGTHYRLENGKTLSTRTKIDFAPQAEIADLISEAGLGVERWFGDYRGGIFGKSSPEIIPFGFRMS